MSVHTPDLHLRNRGVNWRWWVCGLLLLATMINYMDRLTLNLLKVHISRDLGLTNRDYGRVEGYFGLAFAVGAIVFGLIVDRWNVFWVYPLALVGWCAAGFATAFSQGYGSLLLFRMALGFFEAANWPCALRTTQRILPPGERAMGNSILQSGAAAGAIVIPLVLWLLFDENTHPERWQLPFMVVGAAGVCWVALWFFVLRPADLSLSVLPEAVARPDARPALPAPVFWRRFIVLIVLVITINISWHFLRAWLPAFLMEKHGFSQNQTNFFSSAYYAFTDAGALAAGFATLWLARRGMGVHTSRRLVFLTGALLTSLCVVVPFLPGGWSLIAVLLVIGFGALGMFPVYYSFSQDLTLRNQGKLTGALGACCWGTMYLWHNAIGEWLDDHMSYALPFFIAGALPLCAFVVLLLAWGPIKEPVEVDLPLPAPPNPKATLLAPVEERISLAAAAVKEG